MIEEIKRIKKEHPIAFWLVTIATLQSVGLILLVLWMLDYLD